jgi:hypothetical protein
MTRLRRKQRRERNLDFMCACVVALAVGFFGTALACAAVLP